MELSVLAYGLALVGSVALSWLVTPKMIKVAIRLGILDGPSDIKGQDSPVPVLGGTAIVVSFAIAVIAANVIVRPVGGFRELLVILAAGLVLSAMGLVDDFRGLGPVVRLVVEVGAAVALILNGVAVEVFAAEPLNWVLTTFWVVGIVNAFNLLDNMDGLSAGVATIAAISFFSIAAVNGQFLVASLAIALAGVAIGFLWHNRHPATIYMGDAGSLFLGFMLAVIGIKLRFEGSTQVTFLVPILVLGIAIFDTTLVTVQRVRNGRNPLSGGRDHTSHRLVGMGLTVPMAVGVIYAGAAAMGWLAFIIARVDRISAWMLAGLAFALSLVVARILAAVPVYGVASRRVLRLAADHEHEYHVQTSKESRAERVGEKSGA
jgi:UDP-GlcNAc:undecaprenyl-phosphate GlcNAc-1-phosphate transferase